MIFKNVSLIQRYFNTVIHLKPVQIRYRLFYSFRRKWRSFFNLPRVPAKLPTKTKKLPFAPFIPSKVSWLGGKCFKFLNMSHDFEDSIDWNFNRYGKLWGYNLNYFDYLLQPDMNPDKGLELIYDFISQSENNHEGMEPYPISLRGMNWIKFILEYKIDDEKIDASLFSQYNVLVDNLEYHILGNHLLENGFSLFWAGIYFQNRSFLKKSCDILHNQLDAQVLGDGSHFELSPMYHQLMLFRILDSLQLVQSYSSSSIKKGNIPFKKEVFKMAKMMTSKAGIMLGWLDKMTFSSGTTPLFNDSCHNAVPTSEQLVNYAKELSIDRTDVSLGTSGYRRFTFTKYEAIVDAGPIGPSYLPGHGHCDMLSFVLHVNKEPYIVDTGTSTYEVGGRRQHERSTIAHNTVSVKDREQSEVWAAFRVGRRARIKILEDDADFLVAQHDGFKFYHRRKFRFEQDKMYIEDQLLPQGRGTARFHLAPQRDINIGKNSAEVDEILISLKGGAEVWLENYHYAPEFNMRNASKCLCVAFENSLRTIIEFN